MKYVIIYKPILLMGVLGSCHFLNNKQIKIEYCSGNKIDQSRIIRLYTI